VAFSALALSLTLVAPVSAFAISRTAVLSRAQSWIDSPVKYSQSTYHLGYRTDCSGYVSMCWKTGSSWSTRSFHAVSHPIAASRLTPGDALLKKGYHIRLFYGWVDDARTQYVAYESGYGTVAVARIHSIAEDVAAGYVPTRYDRIATSPSSSNLLLNGSFNTWARAWSSQPEQPVWWQSSAPRWQTVVKHRTNTYRSARNALELTNPSGDAATLAELSQSATITAGSEYRLSTWARTGFDPRGIELRLTYLDANGQPVAETSVTGDRAGVNGASFARMSVQLAAPANAVRARAAVRLAGDSSTDESGTVLVGTSAILDDTSLVRQ
jgi:hypothetical protein